MKKEICFCILLVLAVFKMSGQSVSESLVIECTGNKNTSVIFFSPIKSAIIGGDNFVFAYNKENFGKIGLLKGTPGEESNLLVITENGSIFSLTVRYKKEISKSNYFIDDAISIGSENSIIINPKGKKKVGFNIENNFSANTKAVTVNDFQSDGSVAGDSLGNYRAYCMDEVSKPSFYKRIYGSRNKISIKLKNISYVNDDLFFSIILTNESTLDYDINFLNFYITSRKKQKNSTTQTIPYVAKYIHNITSKIKAGDVIDIVYVYSKFTISESKILLVEMSEDNGERAVRLEIPNTFINNPNI